MIHVINRWIIKISPSSLAPPIIYPSSAASTGLYRTTFTSHNFSTPAKHTTMSRKTTTTTIKTTTRSTRTSSSSRRSSTTTTSMAPVKHTSPLRPFTIGGASTVPPRSSPASHKPATTTLPHINTGSKQQFTTFCIFLCMYVVKMSFC
ncbi:hypothetical protein NECAME_18873 [Necator americanus]|uniref:Uncharacterized protein n=1 Tax=Necator americanus TaxID=51031 RepID=W2SU93_NECAM|nr:hypothetical protein NECAME_18873 [Necator americanus]ETN72406.1 hypothetical protein NECAME_18873 [Necator americanus]